VLASRPLPTLPRPDLSDRLLAAVAERDGGLANRLLQQWVHRRGLPSLQAWILGPLAALAALRAWLPDRSDDLPLAC
jgi:hypothetical protein